MQLVKMIREDGKTADVHPDMVLDYERGGYCRMDVEVAPASPTPPAPTGQMPVPGGEVVSAPNAIPVDKMNKRECVKEIKSLGVAPVDGGVAAVREQLKGLRAA